MTESRRDDTRAPDGAGQAHLAAAGATGEPSVEHQRGLVARAKALLDRVQRTRPLRANSRFGRSGGGVLTGGIAYSALFSVAAGLTLGWTVFMAVLGGNHQLRQQVLDAIDASLPGLVKTGSGSGVFSPSDLQLTPTLTVTGVVAIVVLIVSAMSAMAALRTGVRAMFGEPPTAGNPFLAQARALAGFVGMALAILLSAVLSIATTSAADWLLGLVGWTGAGAAFVVRVLGLAVSFVVDMATFVLVVEVLANQRPAWRDLLGGAAIAAFGIGVVRYLGTSVVAGAASKNPLLASVAVVATLLVWINLIARIVLLSAAWVANPPHPDDA
ncbi:YihY/virulence factor BrkB family protein [Isoptericola sp. b441]|uniref:YihY/virulence factor BrkB family protein n=1 Tax=Actinotalea lenta TaxID=3064654 RepID=A0ABT9D9U6_9CELL|nr:YihY/virulence factor BrkB family protein [Isoptericola sp. b441]MDO8106898.1 YihY/virulence factor BrkB family protein [Isoptericola sp. b441]